MKLEFLRYIGIILRLKNLSIKREGEFKDFVKQHPNGVQFLKLLGSWDIELEFEVKDEEQFQQILLEVRNKFSDVIRDYDTLLIYKEIKLDYFPFWLNYLSILSQPSGRQDL